MSDPGDFIIEKGVLKQYVGPGGEVVIPEGVRCIGQGAFRGCTQVTGIAIPESVKSIKKWAFWDCRSLTAIELPASIEQVGQNLLKGCRMLRKVSIPEGITRIEEFAFEDCVSLETVSFPDSLLGIDKGAFKSCRMLRCITIPKHVRWIGEYAFCGCSGVQDLQILTETAIFERHAFDFPDGIPNPVGNYRVSMPDPLAKSLDLNSLKSEFPSASLIFSLLQGPERFSGEFKKKLIALMEKNPKSYFEYLLEQDDDGSTAHFLELRKKLTLDEIDDYLEMANQASDAAKVRAVLLNYKEKHFERKELDRIYRENEEKDLGIREKTVADWRKTYKFSISNGGVRISGYKGNEQTVYVPEKIGKNTVTQIGDRAFSRSWAEMMADRRSETGDETEKSLILPDTIREIGACAFEYSDFSSIGLPKAGVIFSEGIFSWSRIKTIQLPADMKSIPAEAFRGCLALEEVTIPEGMKSIGTQAFRDCRSLTDMRIPEGVNSIGDAAFFDCENLTCVTIRSDMTRIGRWAFRGCKKLTIHAPAGSYAEKYAKENTIPFFAEE